MTARRHRWARWVLALLITCAVAAFGSAAFMWAVAGQQGGPAVCNEAKPPVDMLEPWAPSWSFSAWPLGLLCTYPPSGATAMVELGGPNVVVGAASMTSAIVFCIATRPRRRSEAPADQERQ